MYYARGERNCVRIGDAGAGADVSAGASAGACVSAGAGDGRCGARGAGMAAAVVQRTRRTRRTHRTRRTQSARRCRTTSTTRCRTSPLSERENNTGHEEWIEDSKSEGIHLGYATQFNIYALNY